MGSSPRSRAPRLRLTRSVGTSSRRCARCAPCANRGSRRSPIRSLGERRPSCRFVACAFVGSVSMWLPVSCAHVRTLCFCPSRESGTLVRSGVVKASHRGGGLTNNLRIAGVSDGLYVGIMFKHYLCVPAVDASLRHSRRVASDQGQVQARSAVWMFCSLQTSCSRACRKSGPSPLKWYSFAK